MGFISGSILKEFGKNYAEFYHDPQGAINKLLAEKQGQVAGAFYRKDLGDIDLVWGDIKIGLRKILDKHIDDFSEFGNDINAVGKALDTIISKGKLTTNAGVHTIVFKTEKGTYRVELGKGWLDKGDNNWVITAYKLDKPSSSVSRPSSQVVKGDGTDLRPNGLSNADNIPQNTLNNNKMKGGFITQAMAKNIVPGGVGGGIGAYSAPEDKKMEDLP